MGQAVVSNEEDRTAAVIEDEKSKKNEEDSNSMIKLEKYLPNISVRVLVVESDDSTRQIIGALFRKCSYKVASVSDGLQAWEVLKARPHNIDLILTEVDLPSISGFALLSLIMEHEICKNIPVIMMSNNDSVSTVYKCMLKGAADFLVKPIRTNELKNLWQHVWRRQSMNQQGFGQVDESVGQQKLEATAENNATSDNSLSYKSFAPKQDEGVKKGSDAQSSCGKPDLEAESGSFAEVENQSQPMHTEFTAFGSITNSQKTILCPESQVSGSHALGDGNHTEVGGSKDSFHNSSREAIDLIGALRNYSRPNFNVNDGSNKSEFGPELDLSLRRFRFHSDDVLEDKTSNEKQLLNHSNASAFTTYVNKPQQNLTSVYTPKEQVNTTGDHSSENASGRNTDTKNSPLPYEKKVISLPINPTKDIENGQQNASSQRLFPITFPVRGVQVDVCATPSGRGSTNPSSSSTNQQPNSYMGENGGGNVYLDAENGNDQGCLSRHRSIQREAALNKFRLKRKERCYEKKVRYESRKKLAEQRPRVKGQFVRQVPPDPPPKMGHCGGSLVAN